MFSRYAVYAAKRSFRLCWRSAALIPTTSAIPTAPDLCSAAGPSRIRSRSFATPPPQVNASDLPVDVYHAYSDSTMEKLLDSLEGVLDGLDDPECEVEYSSGVLTLKLGEKGTYVINKQPPNKQIWLSSPISGPKRYDYEQALDDWIYLRDHSSLGQLLNEELSQTLKQEVDLGVRSVSKEAR